MVYDYSAEMFNDLACFSEPYTIIASHDSDSH